MEVYSSDGLLGPSHRPMYIVTYHLPRKDFFVDIDFWIAQYVSFQYLFVCKMNYSAFRDYLRWYVAA